jgi:hypothetical protein
MKIFEELPFYCVDIFIGIIMGSRQRKALLIIMHYDLLEPSLGEK